MTSIKAELLRGANDAISRLLIRTLTVPRIFFAARWPDAQTEVDVLAVDRAGSGDLHVVELQRNLRSAPSQFTDGLLSIPAHFHWVAAVAFGTGRSSLERSGVGLIHLGRMASGELGANIVAKPLRCFTFDRMKLGSFLKNNIPDVEFGEPRSSAASKRAPLPKRKVEKLLTETEKLLSEKHELAAFLLAWSATEAALRLILEGSSQPQMLSPRALVTEMKERGELSSPESSSLDSALVIRNSLVHGLDVPRGVGEACKSLTAIARKTLSKV